MTCQHLPNTMALGRKLDLAVTKVKCQPRVIIWTNLVDLESIMLYTKIQPWSFFGFWEEDFKCFYHKWAWRPSWWINHDHLYKFSILLQQKAPHEVWRKLAHGLQRRSRSNVWMDGRRTDDEGRRTATEHNSSSWALLRWAKISYRYNVVSLTALGFGDMR